MIIIMREFQIKNTTEKSLKDNAEKISSEDKQLSSFQGNRRWHFCISDFINSFIMYS